MSGRTRAQRRRVVAATAAAQLAIGRDWVTLPPSPALRAAAKRHVGAQRGLPTAMLNHHNLKYVFL